MEEPLSTGVPDGDEAETRGSLPPVDRSGPADTCGWTLHRRESSDFFHDLKVYPPELRSWRKEMVARALGDRELFPALAKGATEPEARERVDQGVSYLREIARMLAALHGSPRLGNKDDPVDELVYIILSRKTREDAYQQVYETLKKRFRRWDDLLKAPRPTVERLLRPGGLPRRKADSLYGALSMLRDAFGECTLEPLREWPDAKVEAFLCSLPEINRKSAYCVMMYSLGREVFPVDTHVGRVLARLGPYRDLGLSLEGLDHKQLQATLADLIPPNLRHSLHVNLVEHGRRVCKAPAPVCADCDLKNFCSFYRNSQVAQAKASDAPTAVDLFCGAGGLSTGFTRAGFRVLAAVDLDAAALKTYSVNHPEVPEDRVVCRDIGSFKKGELKRLAGARVDVLLAAPPCQGFSHAGFRSKTTKTQYEVTKDARNYLFEHVITAARELKPRLILMENVPGMQSARNETNSFFEEAARMLGKAGYRTAIWRLNASAHGVAQERIRVFLVASSTDVIPNVPEEEYQDTQRRSIDVDALPPVSVDDAIFDLPPRAASSGAVVDVREPPDLANTPRFRRYLTKFRLVSNSKLLFNHAARYNNDRDLELYALLRPGEDSVHALERHGKRGKALMRYRADVFDDKYARLRPDRPSKTIVSHLAKDGNGYIHPHQVRSITVREAARIQSFPDSYVFCGAPKDQWIQVGNAVPPVLASAIARTFLTVLRSERK